MTRFVVVTGTSTDVGKTVVTAALAALEADAGARVLVVKPAQTGVSDGDPGDAEVVATLAGVPVETFVRLPEPLAPDTAARRAGVVLPRVAAHAARLGELGADCDVVLVEGAGGILVRLDGEGGTLLDLAALLLADGDAVSVVVVCAAGLGVLNHAELTVRAVRDRGVTVAGLVVGSWPDAPGLAERTNLDDLPRLCGVPLIGVVPAGVGGWGRAEFVAGAREWLPGWPR